jgi:predicted nuclease with RNAse H fold/dephospho-CoA kinase
LFSLFDINADAPPQQPRSQMLRPARTRKDTALEARLPAALFDLDGVLFLDVETTGLSWFYDEITLIGWARNGDYKAIIKGENPRPLLEELARAQTLVTFNGTLFDLRFLRKAFGQIPLPPSHIDLRYLSRRVGLTGGQKSIEQELGIDARRGVENIDGAAAVLLWHEFLRGSPEALSSLIDYNRRDVLAMSEILDVVLDRLDVHPHLWLQRPQFGVSARRALSLPLPEPVTQDASTLRQFRTFSTLFSGTRAENAKIIGIDLTGSEKRGSGWCSLHGHRAETDTVFRDDDIIARVVAERPNIVSIDSPLSLPFGRTTVTDDDPARAEFGIMRRCERELKRRGINVYPSLLPSMQGLTQRGMMLADRIRAHGIPVIESYPGAAQDIMGIPRKGAGPEYLKRGLSEFGIRGAYETNDVTHDELDAITSAVVGSFFLSDQYEALRGPTEGALIIPKLSETGPGTMVVGVSGRICAGKTTAAKMLELRGFAYTRFSLVIDDEIATAGVTPSRENRQLFGTKLHLEKGQRWLCEKVLDRVPEQRLIVVDGLRFPEDHAYFAETFGSQFLHLHIVASRDIRESRYETAEGQPSFAMADGQEVESQIDHLKEMAGATISNNHTVDDLESAVIRALRDLAPQEFECLSRSS